MLGFLKKVATRIRFTVLLIACVLNVMQTALAFAADTADMCNPDTDVGAQRQAFRQQNDVLYFDDCDNKCSEATGAGTLPGDNNAERAYNYLIAHGYTPPQAAGIVGNMILESGVNPERMQGTGLNDQTGYDQALGRSGGWGIVQWTPPDKMINPTRDAGKDPNDLTAQLDYLTAGNELNGGASGDAAEKVRATSNVDDATQAFGQAFESPADLGSSIEQRKTYAEAIYNKATQGTPYPPQVESAIYKDGSASPSNTTLVAPTGAAQGNQPGCTQGARDNGECKNPFRDLKNSGPMRFDGGFDFGGNNGSGPVYAACPAQIEEVTTGSGWPGNPGLYLRYKLTSGKAANLQMYIAEDCTAAVKTGDTVTADQPICNYQDSGTHLETGWAKEDCYCGTNSSYVSWSDYPQHDNDFASNSGVDVGTFLTTLGAPKGVVDEGPSTVPPPPSWPKW